MWDIFNLHDFMKFNNILFIFVKLRLFKSFFFKKSITLFFKEYNTIYVKHKSEEINIYLIVFV